MKVGSFIFILAIHDSRPYVLLPRDLLPVHLTDRSVVVFDVLRATTSITAALAAGVTSIGVFGSISEARGGSNRRSIRSPLRRASLSHPARFRPRKQSCRFLALQARRASDCS